MTNMTNEAIIALLGLLIAIPPTIFAYLQWKNANRRRLPYHAPRGHPRYQLNIFINAPNATNGFSRKHQRTSSGCNLEATGDNS
ncbi:hypothetical protein RB213_015861 [Colletotrichum asianum]